MEIYIVCPRIMWRVYNWSLSPDFVCFRPWFGHGTETSPLNGFWPKIFVWLWIYTEAGRASCWVMRSSHSSSWGDFNKDFFKYLSSTFTPASWNHCYFSEYLRHQFIFSLWCLSVNRGLRVWSDFAAKLAEQEFIGSSTQLTRLVGPGVLLNDDGCSEHFQECKQIAETNNWNCETLL